MIAIVQVSHILQRIRSDGSEGRVHHVIEYINDKGQADGEEAEWKHMISRRLGRRTRSGDGTYCMSECDPSPTMPAFDEYPAHEPIMKDGDPPPRGRTPDTEREGGYNDPVYGLSSVLLVVCLLLEIPSLAEGVSA